MKNILTISILVISLLSCKAQQIVTPIFGNASPPNNPNNYQKDVDNDFNKFVGTWKYQDTTIEFIIKLKKEEQINDNYGSYIYDCLVGEYLYKENGTIIVNTLSDFDDPAISGYGHKITGKSIIGKNHSPHCDDCSIVERRMRINMDNPNHPEGSGQLILRHINDNGIEKMEVILYDASSQYHREGTPRNTLGITPGTFTFIKQ